MNALAMKNRQILFPTDLSDQSAKSLAGIIPILKRGKNKLVLLHAAQRKRKSLAADKVAIEGAFDRFESLCPDLKDLKYERRWEFRIAKELIIEESDKIDCDLIVMMTSGAKGIDRLWGSRTESVVRDAMVPVIVLPEGASIDSIDKIILAADFTDLDCGDHRLLPLLHIADHLKTEIEVLTINRKESEMSRKEKFHRKQLKYRLQEFPHRFSHHFEEEIGAGLIKYAKDHKASLIAIMPHDYHFVEGLFHESLSRKMIYESPIPLLILK